MNISGKVIKGEMKGRNLGFPTANIKTVSDFAIDSGIYAGYIVFSNQRYQSALYIRDDKVIEAFIFNFNGDLYGQNVNVEIGKKIRKKIDFKNDEQAIRQIIKDVEKIKKCLQE